MKAEHRKELHTNLLADRMGRLVQRIKTRPKRRVILYILLAAVVIGGIFIFLRMRQSSAEEESSHWMMLEDGFIPYQENLARYFKETNQGKAARFIQAWQLGWEGGLKRLGGDPLISMRVLEDGEKFYKQLATDCSEDPVLGPEALFMLGAIEEARAIHLKDRNKHLDNAVQIYKKLADTYKTSAYAKLAKKQIEILGTDAKDKKREEVQEFYENLRTRLQVPESNFLDGLKDLNLPPTSPGKK